MSPHPDSRRPSAVSPFRERERRPIPIAPFIHLLKFPVHRPPPSAGPPMGPLYGETPIPEPSSTHKPLAYEPSPRFPIEAPMETDAHLLSHFYTSLFPWQSYRKERCSISGALLPLFLTVPCKWTPSPGSPTGPLWRQLSTEPSTSHPLKIHLSLRVPSKGAPSIFPNRVPTDIDTPSPEPLSIYSCMSSRVPKKKPSYKMWKNIRSPCMEPHADGTPTYNRVRPGSPRGLLTTLLSLPQCHAALGTVPTTLAGVDQSPISHRLL